MSTGCVKSVQSLSRVWLRPHVLQHTSLPCSSPTPGACSNSCPLSRWCHPTISSSVLPFSSRLQCFPASGSFLISQFFTSGGQSTGVSAFHHSFQRNPRADLLQNGLVGSPCSPRDSPESSPTPQLYAWMLRLWVPPQTLIVLFHQSYKEGLTYDRPSSYKQPCGYYRNSKCSLWGIGF